MNYILEKTNKQVVWINPDPNQLTGVEAWGEFNPSIHEIVYALHYNPQIGDTFRAEIMDGMAQDFKPKAVYNKSTGVNRVLFNWDDCLDPEKETENEPLKDEKGSLLSHQIYTERDGWIVDVVQKKDSLIKLVDSICESKITAGFASTALGTPYFYSSDRDDQLNLVGLASLNASVLYKCTDDDGIKEYRNHTADQIKQVLNDGAVRKTLLLKNCASLKAMIQAVGADSKLDEIDITSGWD
ncbi:hypothetical protein [Leptospira santarosai]|uniref:DUF4376 domain-containing protein n=1 Tax=Leptospira santarosai serovar Shermani str. LT 821 TaxID=758847 RepID=K8Y4I9_9LEPT|nr:hypothetical protein [Leptospira santarosai]EKT88344.1 hypothetical protein LSS_03099 [Leptospira santarosai serovar Shermani str. LT 821]EMO86587.1 hypothetical protein LEP1GSC070_0852 [Leptospira santarosai str. AIM]EPG81094.1 hypothetical protein LEP1GSC048_3924 [Leptospira santarosai serovar Shermani str. 1342KT]